MLLKIFWVFAKIGAFTLGGGYAMVPLIQSEVVDKKGWIEREEFVDILAVAQSTPGALAVNMATFVGFRIRGLIGAVVAALGCVLPSFVIILIIAMFFSRFMDVKLIQRAFMGIRPAVAALIAFSVVKIARTSKIKLMWYSVAALAAAAILLLKMDPIVIIILSALIGLSSWVIGLIKGRGGRNEHTN